MTDQPRLLKFYFDTHISKVIAVQLRKHGVDVVRCEEVGLNEADDPHHLAYATEHGRVLVTHDADFIELHDEWLNSERAHTGIIRVNPDFQGPPGIGTIVKRLLEYHELVEGGAATVSGDFENQLIFVS